MGKEGIKCGALRFILLMACKFTKFTCWTCSPQTSLQGGGRDSGSFLDSKLTRFYWWVSSCRFQSVLSLDFDLSSACRDWRVSVHHISDISQAVITALLLIVPLQSWACRACAHNIRIKQCSIYHVHNTLGAVLPWWCGAPGRPVWPPSLTPTPGTHRAPPPHKTPIN